MILSTVMVVTSGCTTFGLYKIESITGTIIDAQTKKPVEGAVVVVERPIYGGYHGGLLGFVEFQETITDKNGGFFLPALGVKNLDGYIDTSSPYLVIFKAGYQYTKLRNLKESDIGLSQEYRQHEWLQTSIWNGTKIEITRFTGSKEEYKQELFDISKAYNWYDSQTRDKKCSWVGMDLPLFYSRLNNETTKHGENLVNDIIEMMHKQEPNCEQWNAFFEEYKK